MYTPPSRSRGQLVLTASVRDGGRLLLGGEERFIASMADLLVGTLPSPRYAHGFLTCAHPPPHPCRAEEKIALSGGGIPESRRIYQGEETGEFTRMFRGTIVIRRGPRVPASEPVMEMFEAKVDPSDRFTRLVSVECSPRSLSSRVRVLLTGAPPPPWCGRARLTEPM